jgi:hypothetical protein
MSHSPTWEAHHGEPSASRVVESAAFRPANSPGVNTASGAGDDCGAQQACQVGNDVGTAVGAGLIVFLWAAGAVILGVIWLVTNSRSASREPRERPPDNW